MSLKVRKFFFKKLASRLNCKKINDLMLEIKIEDKLFKNLYDATFNYVTKCFGTKKIIKSEKEIFDFIKKIK